MSTLLSRRLAILTDPVNRPLLLQGLRGIERETLRSDRSGRLARTTHPSALGAPLTHPHITTDYAEALLEFVTGALPNVSDVLSELDRIHRFVYRNLGEEILWSQSMPCGLPSEDEIDIAAYGSSNIGMLKHIYRQGLALRYGKSMQCIAGIHYNFSLADNIWPLLSDSAPSKINFGNVQSAGYFALIRNFRRYSWLLMYLFGASPAVSTCFLRGQVHHLQTLSDDTLYLPFATSLRMSDLGYQSNAQAMLSIEFDNVDNYIHSLSEAVSQPYAPYEQIGMWQDGRRVQLNTNLLQIENEYYSTIRPKRVIGIGERALQALALRGVQYVEVRCLDVDPFQPSGISLETARFMDAFLMLCALEDSPLSRDQGHEDGLNFASVVTDGRRPGLMLTKNGVSIEMQTWAEELLQNINQTAELLDLANDVSSHTDSVRVQLQKITDVSLTPSALVMTELEKHNNSFARFGLHQSILHAKSFESRPLDINEERDFKESVEKSISGRETLEKNQSATFDEFAEAYLKSVHSVPAAPSI